VGLGASAPMEPMEGFLSLCHAAYVTLLEEWASASRARWSGQLWGAPERWMLGGPIDGRGEGV
jgi:hypothetical protein